MPASQITNVQVIQNMMLLLAEHFTSHNIIKHGTGHKPGCLEP